MYGQPMKPNRCEFDLSIEDDDNEIVLCIGDLDEPDNDDIRDVDHPDFDKYWGNACENIFTAEIGDHFASLDDARQWCLSIGMIEADEPLGLGG